MSMMLQTLQTHIDGYLSRLNALPVTSRLQRLLWYLICTRVLEPIS